MLIDRISRLKPDVFLMHPQTNGEGGARSGGVGGKGSTPSAHCLGFLLTQILLGTETKRQSKGWGG